MRWLLIGLLFLGGCAPIRTPISTLDSMQVIADTQHHVVQSERIGRDLHLLVRLPAGYDKSVRYPTVYLLDGGNLYPMLGAYYQYLRYEEAAPDIIIVGISYAASTFPDGNYRSTDFTAPSPEREYWGGAATFQKVLIEDILPTIESRYASDPDQRVLFGQSLAGQFVLFNALTDPGLFFGHIASNLAIHRNLDFFLGRPYQAGKTKLFISGSERDAPDFAEPRNRWLAVQSESADLKIVSILDQGHFSIVPESFRQGLRWLFNHAP